MAKSLINVKVIPRDHNLDLLIAFARYWQTDYQGDVERGLATLRAEIRDIARRQPGAVAYPIVWTPSHNPADAGKKPNTQLGYYSRQKAAFYATDGFGNGIPTVRTGDMANAWKVRTRHHVRDTVLELTNDSPAFPFVEGDWQQEFHINTMWPNSDTIVSDVQVLVDATVEPLLDAIVSDFLGGP